VSIPCTEPFATLTLVFQGRLPRVLREAGDYLARIHGEDITDVVVSIDDGEAEIRAYVRRS